MTLPYFKFSNFIIVQGTQSSSGTQGLNLIKFLSLWQNVKWNVLCGFRDTVVIPKAKKEYKCISAKQDR